MFDASNRQTCRVRSSVTSTPLHSMTTLNDPTWVEAARALAESCLQSANSTSERIELAMQRVLCRPATATEIDVLARGFERQLSMYRENESAASELLSVGESPRDESLSTAEHAAFTVTCLSILNLDEALTRL